MMQPGVVVYESTSYPGATEEVCAPILERESGGKFNRDFCCGYSLDRINPDDKQYRLTAINNVTSGAMAEYGLETSNQAPKSNHYEAIVLAVAHRQFVD